MERQKSKSPESPEGSNLPFSAAAQDADSDFRAKSALIAVTVTLIVVYGSLYPFHFFHNADSAGPFRRLITTWRGPFGRGDFLANVLLYFPLGLFLVKAIPRWSPIARIGVVIFSGFSLSLAIELLQFFDYGRVSALADVYANTVGVATGAVAGAIPFRREFRWRTGFADRRPFVVLLLSCWLGYRLFPFVPVIDLHKYWSAIKPLIFSPAVTLSDFYRHAAVWLAVALLIEALLGVARSRLVIPILVFLLLCARIFILDTALSPAEVAGALCAVLLWQTLVSRLKARAGIVAVLFVGVVGVAALRPFHFATPAQPFGWIPFASFMRGSIETNVRSFLEKAFTYGALVWMIVRAGSSLALAVGLGSVLVLCLRLGQMFLPGRSAEITDPLMVLIAGGVMKLIGEQPSRHASAAGHTGWRAAAYQLLTRSDRVQPVDVIIVMAGRMDRKSYGLELYRAGLAPRLILSVGRYEVSKMAPAGWENLDELKSVRDQTPASERHFFVTMDVSGASIQKAALPTWSTYGEAIAFRSLLQHQPPRKVMVVSTDVHLRRVALTFANVFEGTPIEFLFCPVPAHFGTMASDTWWRRPADRRFFLLEMTKLAGYCAALSAPGWAAHRLLLLTGWGRK